MARGGRRAAVHTTTWVHARLYPRMDRRERATARANRPPKAAAREEAFACHSRWPTRQKRQRSHSHRKKGRATFRHVSAFKQLGMGAYGDVGRQRWSAREKLHQQLASLRPFRLSGIIGGARTKGATNKAKGGGKRKPTLAKGQQTLPLAFGSVSPPPGSNRLQENERWVRLATDTLTGVKYRHKDAPPGEERDAATKRETANNTKRRVALRKAGYTERDGRCFIITNSAPSAPRKKGLLLVIIKRGQSV